MLTLRQIVCIILTIGCFMDGRSIEGTLFLVAALIIGAIDDLKTYNDDIKGGEAK